MALERDYEVLKQLGEGAFGKVYKAQHRGTGDVVAVKQIKLGSRSWDEALKSMELQALKALRHPFIVRLRELMRSPQDGSLYYVFEFLGSDLFRHIREHPNGLEEPRAAELSRQLLSALGHMHQLGFFHRDVKPENILFDVPSSTIRLADFGETRSLRARPPFTDYVGTRWYRAPECLLRFRAYSSPVDVWAAGLVLAEMLRGSALFCGSSAIDQLYKVFQVLGSSGTSDWPEFRQLAGEMRFRLPDGQGCGLGRCLPGCSPLAQAAVGEILVPNPRRRPAAKRFLEHPFFAQLPPLDLERDCRSAPTAAAAAAGPGTGGYPSPCAAPGGAGGAPPRAAEAAPLPEAEATLQPSRGSSHAGGGGGGERGAGDDNLDHLDLDAELDRILGGSSAQLSPQLPVARARQEHAGGAEASRAGAGGAQAEEVGLRGSPTLGSPTLQGTMGVGGLTGLLGSFSFTPMARPPQREGGEGSCAAAAPGPLARGAAGAAAGAGLGAEAPRAGLAAEASPVGSAAQPGSSAASRGSPGASVDVLLDSLCADLGVSPARARAPSPERARAGAAPEAALEAAAAAAAAASAPPVPAATPEPVAEEQEAHPGGRQNLNLRTAMLLSEPEASESDSDWDREEAAEEAGGLHPSEPGRAEGAAAAPTADPGAAGQAPAEALRPWSPEEASRLRRAVKKVAKRRAGEAKKIVWEEVCQELGGGRAPRECKAKYTEDYRAHKARAQEDGARQGGALTRSSAAAP